MLVLSESATLGMRGWVVVGEGGLCSLIVEASTRSLKSGKGPGHGGKTCWEGGEGEKVLLCPSPGDLSSKRSFEVAEGSIVLIGLWSEEDMPG